MRSNGYGLVFLLLLMTFWAGCAGSPLIVVDGIQIYQHRWYRAVEEVAPRAAYDFQCPRQAIRFSLVAMYRRNVATMGAEGCGHRTTYSQVGTQWFARDQGNAAAATQQQVDQAAAAAAAQRR